MPRKLSTSRVGRSRRPTAGTPTLLQVSQPLDSTKLVDRALEKIEELIVTLQMPPGSTWTEQTLTRHLGIGRTPVREAIQQLAGAHLVSVIPRHGVKVSEISAQEYLLVLEVRRELDRLVAVQAARRSWPDEKRRIAEYARTMSAAAQADDAVAFMREHFASRQIIASATRNPFLSAATKPLDSLSRRFFFYLHKTIGYDLQATVDVHTEVLRAIANGNEKAAAKASDDQIEFAERRVRELMRTQP
jgi:DNA-binding GntR family transcriptional regulator